MIDVKKLFSQNFVLKNNQFNHLGLVLILLCVAAILLFLNAIWNLLNKTSGHFLFGTIFLIFMFVFVIFIGLTLRDVRKN